MKKILLVTVILIFSLTSIILLNLRSSGGNSEMLRLFPENIKEIVYKVDQKTVLLELHRKIKNVTVLNFRNFSRTEALLLMDLLINHKRIIVEADLDTGYVYDFGFTL